MRLQSLSLSVCLALPLAAQPPAPRVRIPVVNHGPASYLGVGVVEVDSEIAKSVGLKEERGVEVTQVEADSPASKAGLKEHDVILDYNGQRIEGTTQFVRMVSETPVGRKAALGIFRNGSTQTLYAQVGSRAGQNSGFLVDTPLSALAPMPPSVELTMPDIPSGLLGWQSSTLGYMSEPIDGQLAEFFGVKEGVLVRSVVAKSPAEKAGLKAGDVIVKADGTAVKSPREITGMLRRQHENKHLSLTVIRAHKELTLDLIAMNTVDSALLVMEGAG